MDLASIIERVTEVSLTSSEPAAAGRSSLESAITASSEVTAWLAAAKARMTTALAAEVSFPEKTIAECTRESVRDAAKATERADTLGKVPGFADALDAAAVTAGHVDAITSKAKPLTDSQRAEYFERVAGLVAVASSATVEEFRRRLAHEARATERDDGMDRLERQRRDTRVRVWTDTEGMWRLDGRFDPLSGVDLDARLEAAVQAMFAESVPDTCPTDPVLKQQHLRALALQRLLLEGGVGRPGRREVVVVVDADAADGAGGPTVDWGIPVEIPTRVLAEMCVSERTDVVPVVVRNGVVLHAPGDLDLGRATRLASPTQRRALRAIYPTCAIPGCDVPKVHDHGWTIALGPNRELTITFPDGTIHNTGPPNRRAA
jgi:hypothetical protein